MLLTGFRHFPGFPEKKFTFYKTVYLRPPISRRNSLLQEINLIISSFKNSNSKLVFRGTMGIIHYFLFSGYCWPTFHISQITNYFEMACIWTKMIKSRIVKKNQLKSENDWYFSIFCYFEIYYSQSPEKAKMKE